MSVAVNSLMLLDSLHFAVDYIPKRAIRFFTASENKEETISLLIDEIKDVFEHPEEFVEEGSQLLFYGFMILGHFYAKEGISLISEMGRLEKLSIDHLVGERLFDSLSLAFAQICSEDIGHLKEIIEDSSLDECIRATCIQSMVYLYSQEKITRQSMVEYFLYLLRRPREKITFFYEMIVSASLILHPEELIEDIRKLFEEGGVDSSEVTLEDVEEIFELNREEVIQEHSQIFRADLDDLIHYLESIEGFHSHGSVDRNEICPCGSGIKYKKCCR